MAELRRTIKDSVFTYMARQPEYTRELYLALHPEDADVTEADIKLVTLENVLTVGQYNDVGFQVRNQMIVLAEAQTIFSYNLPLRMLMYLSETYKEYAVENELNLYARKTLRLPRPELYVIYAGDETDVPDILHLSDSFDGRSDVSVDVRVLRANGKGDLVDQYVRFCRITDEVRKQPGNAEKGVKEIIRRCESENVLTTFLESRKKEVFDIMVTLFDEEWVSKMYEKELREEAREEGCEVERSRTLKKLMKNLGLSMEDALKAMGIPAEEQSRYLQTQ